MSRLQTGALGTAALCLQLMSAVRPAYGQISEFTWGSPEVLDVGAVEVSTAAGASVQGVADGTGETWDVVYLQDGRVCRIARSGGVWGASEALSPMGVVARNPQIVRLDGGLHVVWEDDRAGHPEIWTRRSTGGTWTAEECLTSDAVRSAAPSLAGEESQAFLAWEEGETGSTRILMRSWNGSAWAPAQQVSPQGVAAFEPSVSSWAFWGESTVVAWADARHGESEIYMRRFFGGWEPEVRVTDMAGNCRKPSLHAEACCYDYLMGNEQIGFLNDSGGVPRAWRACLSQGYPAYVTQVSTDRAQSIAAGGFAFSYEPVAPFGGPIAFNLLAWTEGASTPTTLRAQTAVGEYCDPRSPVVLTSAALSGPVVAAVEGSPLAGGLVLWTEQQGTTRRLVAAIGTAPGCEEQEVVAPPALLVAPEGIPGTSVRIRNACNGEFIHPYSEAQIRFDAGLNGAITWDPAQPHPDTGYIHADDSGAYVFHIRGGKCVPSGTAWFQVNGLLVSGWTGVRSPDIDGDCAVRDNDRAYVAARIGTADYCADLDGSGLVDAADLAIVDATYGDRCSNVTEAGEPFAAVPGFELSIPANPITGNALLRLRLGAAATVGIEILDASGRRVRSFGEMELPQGNSVLTWDRRDEGGRIVAPGVYFVAGRSRGEQVQRKLILLH